MNNFEITRNKIMSMKNAYFFHAMFPTVDECMRALRQLSFISVDSQGNGNKPEEVHLAIARLSDGAALIVGGRLSPKQLETLDVMELKSDPGTLIIIPPKCDTTLQGRLKIEKPIPGIKRLVIKPRTRRKVRKIKKNLGMRVNQRGKKMMHSARRKPVADYPYSKNEGRRANV